jgi:hypothetical protein
MNYLGYLAVVLLPTWNCARLYKNQCPQSQFNCGDADADAGVDAHACETVRAAH